MFCSKCGKELEENATNCKYCETMDMTFSLDDETSNSNQENSDVNQPFNQTVQVNQNLSQNSFEEQAAARVFPSSMANSYNQQENTESKFWGIKKSVVIGASIAVLLLGSIGVVAKTTDVFKSPKEIYLKAEGKFMMGAINNFKDEYKNNYEKNVKPLLEKPYESKLEYSAKADLSSIPGLDRQTSSKISELLENSKITLETKANPTQNQSSSDVALYIKGNKLINANIIQDNTKLAASVPALYSKYLTLDMKDLNSLMRKNGYNTYSKEAKVPNRILAPQDVLKVVKFEDSQYIGLLKNFGKVLGDSIGEKQVTLEKGVAFKVNDIDMKCKKLTVAVDEKTFEGMIIKLVETAEKDDRLYDLTAQNILNILKLYKDAGYETAMNGNEDFDQELSKENFKNALSALKSNLAEAFEDVSFPDGVKMTVYLDGDKIVGRTLEAKIKPQYGNEVSFVLNYSGVSEYKNRNISNIEGKFTSKDSSINEVVIKSLYDTKIDKKASSEVGTQNITVDVKGDGFSANVFKANIGVNNTKGETDKYVYDYDVTMGSPMGGKISAKGSLKLDSWEKSKENKIGNELTFSIDAKSPQRPSDKISGSINVKAENTLNTKFSLPAIDSNNSVDISKADNEELQEIQNEVMMSAQKFMMNNPDIMKMLQ